MFNMDVKHPLERPLSSPWGPRSLSKPNGSVRQESWLEPCSMGDSYNALDHRMHHPSLPKNGFRDVPWVRSQRRAVATMPSDATETIAECLAQARSDTEEAQDRALQALSSLTKISSHNRDLLAQTHEAIPTILSLSKAPSTTTTTQVLSLSILFNLSLNPNLKRSLAKMEIIHLLNSIILSPSSPQVGQLAASLICSIAMLDKNKASFGVAGTVEAIIKALENPEHSCSSHHLLSCLAELVQFHGNCTLAVRAGAVPALVRIIKGPSMDVGGSSLTILGLLARFEEGINSIRSTDGVVGILVDALRRRCTVSRESAAEILIRLFEDSEESLKEAAAKPEFSSLLADLSIQGSAKAREKAGLIMQMMMEADLDCYVEGNPMVLR